MMTNLFITIFKNPLYMPVISAIIAALMSGFIALLIAILNIKSSSFLKQIEYESSYFKELALHRFKVIQDFENTIWPAYQIGIAPGLDQPISKIFSDRDSFLAFYFQANSLKEKRNWLSEESRVFFDDFMNTLLDYYSKILQIPENNNSSIQQFGQSNHNFFFIKLNLLSSSLHQSYFEIHALKKLKKEQKSLQKKLKKEIVDFLKKSD